MQGIHRCEALFEVGEDVVNVFRAMERRIVLGRMP